MANADKPFNRETLEAALLRLGEISWKAGKTIEISIYGGAALVLSMDYRVSTRDVDAVFRSDGNFIRTAASVVAQEFGWESTWINDGVKGFLSAKDASSRAKSLFRSYPNENEPGLRVFVASPSYLFAMKCLAMRVGGVGESEDIGDIKHLGALLGVQNLSAALEIIARYYPAGQIPAKTQFGLEEIFGR